MGRRPAAAEARARRAAVAAGASARPLRTAAAGGWSAAKAADAFDAAAAVTMRSMGWPSSPPSSSSDSGGDAEGEGGGSGQQEEGEGEEESGSTVAAAEAEALPTSPMPSSEAEPAAPLSPPVSRVIEGIPLGRCRAPEREGSRLSLSLSPLRLLSWGMGETQKNGRVMRLELAR